MKKLKQCFKQLWLFILCTVLAVLTAVAAEKFLLSPQSPPPPVIVDVRPNIDPDVQLMVAVHEAGHAIGVAYLRGPEYVSGIDMYVKLPKSELYGQVRMRTRPELDTRDSFMRDIVITLAGRAADVIVNGAPNDGAASDLRNATNTLVTMYVRAGLSDRLLVRERDDVPESTREVMERELQAANACAEAVIRANQGVVLRVANVLLALPADEDGKRTLTGDAFTNLINEVRLRPLSDAEQAQHISQCVPIRRWKPEPQMCPKEQFGPPVPPGFTP